MYIFVGLCVAKKTREEVQDFIIIISPAFQTRY